MTYECFPRLSRLYVVVFRSDWFNRLSGHIVIGQDWRDVTQMKTFRNVSFVLDQNRSSLQIWTFGEIQPAPQVTTFTNKNMFKIILPNYGRYSVRVSPGILFWSVDIQMDKSYWAVLSCAAVNFSLLYLRLTMKNLIGREHSINSQFGFRMISWIIKTSCLYYLQPSAYRPRFW